MNDRQLLREEIFKLMQQQSMTDDHNVVLGLAQQLQKGFDLNWLPA